MSGILAAAVLGFLLGSLPFGFLLVRVLTGRDVRSVGSGNIGATNVGRVLGRSGWAVTLLADAGKGAAAVGLAHSWLGQGVEAAAAAGFAAIVGHCYTPWLGLRGGKGVATMLGVFLALAPLATLASVVGFALIALTTRYVSLASLVAAVVLPVATWMQQLPLAVSVAAVATALLVLLRHRDNIGRLLRGSESRIGGGGK